MCICSKYALGGDQQNKVTKITRVRVPMHTHGARNREMIVLSSFEELINKE